MVIETKLTNEELDAKVLESIRSGKTRAAAVQAHLLLGPNAARALDRSLQRLRRRGLIEYGGPSTFTGWRAV